MTTWAVVANAARARLYALEGRGAPLKEIEDLIWAEGQLKGHELEADAPGRSFDSAGAGRHAMEPSLDPRAEEAARFAHEIADQLESSYKQHKFDQLCVIAPPGFLGLLRREIGKPLSGAVAGELNKDLTHAGTDRIATELWEML
jgi:protein required for attachment to host cells